MPNENKLCDTCGRQFYVNEKDQKFFADQGFPTPKRCFFCRKARKAAKDALEGKKQDE